jgi:hypothetical protein
MPKGPDLAFPARAQMTENGASAIQSHFGKLIACVKRESQTARLAYEWLAAVRYLRRSAYEK